MICSAWGFRRSLLLKRRCTLLRELRLLVEQYSIEISCTAPTLAELAGNSGGEFGRLLCECSGSETDIRRAWSNAVDRLSAEPGCGGEEVSLLRELGRELGTCPAESQLALLKLYSARFDKLISAAITARSFARVSSILRIFRPFSSRSGFTQEARLLSPQAPRTPAGRSQLPLLFRLILSSRRWRIPPRPCSSRSPAELCSTPPAP